MKFISWNVNGLRACVSKGFEDFFKAENADFFCIQETKMQEGQLDLNFDGYYKYFNYAEKKGYSGTAIYTKYEPISVVYGINGKYNDEGRAITLEYADMYLINLYVPNSQDELARLDYRMVFEDDLREYVSGLKKTGKKVIICGDMNVAVEEIDLKNPKTNHFNPGFSDEERQKMRDLKAAGFIDTFRHLYPETATYSWWSYRFKCREKNIGWRIDYFLVNDEYEMNIKEAMIYTDVLGSDHCPVGLILE